MFIARRAPSRALCSAAPPRHNQPCRSLHLSRHHHHGLLDAKTSMVLHQHAGSSCSLLAPNQKHQQQQWRQFHSSMPKFELKVVPSSEMNTPPEQTQNPIYPQQQQSQQQQSQQQQSQQQQQQQQQQHFAEIMELDFLDGGGSVYLVATTPHSNRFKSNIQEIVQSVKPSVVFADIDVWRFSLLSQPATKTTTTAKTSVQKNQSSDPHPDWDLAEKSSPKVLVAKAVQKNKSDLSPPPTSPPGILFSQIVPPQDDAIMADFKLNSSETEISFQPLQRSVVDSIRDTIRRGTKCNLWNWFSIQYKLSHIRNKFSSELWNTILGKYISFRMDFFSKHRLGDHYRTLFYEAGQVGADFVLMERDFRQQFEHAFDHFIKGPKPTDLFVHMSVAMLQTGARHMHVGTTIDAKPESAHKGTLSALEIHKTSPQLFRYFVLEKVLFFREVIEQYKRTHHSGTADFKAVAVVNLQSVALLGQLFHHGTGQPHPDFVQLMNSISIAPQPQPQPPPPQQQQPQEQAPPQQEHAQQS